jgi:hypothetical protein
MERVGSASTQNPEKRSTKKTGNLADQEGSKRGGLKRIRFSTSRNIIQAKISKEQVILNFFKIFSTNNRYFSRKSMDRSTK